ncbi:C-type lectin domain 10 member [Mactra antiquata]
MWTSIAVFTSLCVAGILGATCPDGFEGHQGSCYFFSHGKATWMDAYESCTDLFGAKLAEVTSDAENAYISQRTVTLGGSNYWIGLTDPFVEGSFFWMSNTQPLTGPTYWAPDEPDVDPTDNCVRYSHSHHNLWSDTSCTDEAYYICEMPDGAAEIIG